VGKYGYATKHTHTLYGVHCLTEIMEKLLRSIHTHTPLRPNSYSLTRGIKSTLVDSSIGLPKAHDTCVRVDSGVDIRRG